MQLNGSEIIIECLKEQGVDTVFGYPGGAILNLYDALYKHSDEITHILASHEQGASHAADGYARSVSYTHLDVYKRQKDMLPNVLVDYSLMHFARWVFHL